MNAMQKTNRNTQTIVYKMKQHAISLSRLVHFCCLASRNAREEDWEDVEAPPNLFTTAVEKAAKKAVYAKRFRSCHIGTNTCRSACPVSPLGLLHLPRQFWGIQHRVEKKIKRKRNTHYIQFVEY